MFQLFKKYVSLDKIAYKCEEIPTKTAENNSNKYIQFCLVCYAISSVGREKYKPHETLYERGTANLRAAIRFYLSRSKVKVKDIPQSR